MSSNGMSGMLNAMIQGKFEVPLYADKAAGMVLLVKVTSYMSGDTEPSGFIIRFKDPTTPVKHFKWDQFKLAVMLMMPETREQFRGG